MVNGIGSGAGGLGREAILAAMKSVSKQASSIQGSADEISSQSGIRGQLEAPQKTQNFTQQLSESLKSLDAKVKGIDKMPEDLVSGKIESIHEVAIQLKQAQFSFRFAMEIRNKLLDAYREVMRMNV